MEGYPHILLALGLGLGLAAAAGLRVFVPLLVLGIASRYGVIPLASGFEWLQSAPALLALGTATVLEVLAYYVPWFDNLLDTVATPSAAVAGVVATASVLGELPPWMQWGIAIVGGGGTAGLVAGSTSLLRLKSTAFTGGSANFVLATIEWVGSLFTSIVAIVLPVLMLLVLAIASYVLYRVTRRFARPRAAAAIACLGLLGAGPWVGPAGTQPAEPASTPEVRYTIACPEPARRYVIVTADFPAAAGKALVIRMSRTSPGRYALHEFGKNVFGEEATDSQGRAVAVQRTGLHEWTVAGHDGRVRFTYRVYGDSLDGTYLAVDETHAHMNAPATLAWAPGLEQAPARVRLVPPPGVLWRVATQLFPTSDPLVFTAPNLPYLMDSPIEFGDIALHAIRVEQREGGPEMPIRVALHNHGSYPTIGTFLRDIERIVAEERAIFGELPAFEPGHYTFITDTLPWANGDGMEHRNSTIITVPVPLPAGRKEVLDTVAHEFFHAWNVERIRPRSLEPFDLTDASYSSELWLGEGFTQYYGVLVMGRAGLDSLDSTLASVAGLVTEVTTAPGRQLRSAVEMSRLAAFEDRARTADRTVSANTFLSYYTFGAAIALGLDLSLRDRSNGRVSLDDFMRTLWQRHGAPGGSAPGLVGWPYAMDDLVSAMAHIAEDRPFAEEFFRRFVEGRELPDYARLLERAGLRLRPAAADHPWVGRLSFEGVDGGLRVRGLPPAGTPAWDAGLAEDDVVRSVDGNTISSVNDWERVLARCRPGDRVAIAVERRGRVLALHLLIGRHPAFTIVPIERDGGHLTPGQDVFRRAWLGAKAPVAVNW